MIGRFSPRTRRLGCAPRCFSRRPAQPVAVVLTEADLVRMDDELAAHYERVRRGLVCG
jgi:hypothetical protein